MCDRNDKCKETYNSENIVRCECFLAYMMDYLLPIASLWSSISECVNDNDSSVNDLGLTNAPIESYFRTIIKCVFKNKSHNHISEVVGRLERYTSGSLRE